MDKDVMRTMTLADFGVFPDGEKASLVVTSEDRDNNNKPGTYYIYFIQMKGECPHCSPVKIGRSIHISKRLDEVGLYSPFDVELLGVIKGSKSDEQEMQKRFSLERMRGDWFRPSDRLIEHIEENADELEETYHGRHGRWFYEEFCSYYEIEKNHRYEYMDIKKRVSSLIDSGVIWAGYITRRWDEANWIDLIGKGPKDPKKIVLFK